MVKPKIQQKDAENKIIEKLARYGPSHIYPFHKVGSKYYIAARGTIYRAKDSLIKKNLIVKKEESGSPPKKIYGLTLFGLLAGYGENVLTTKHIYHLIEAFKEDVPLVFGEWDYFKKRGVGVEKIATKHLINTLKGCEAVHKQVLGGWKKYMQRKNRQKTRLENAYNNNEWLTKEGVAQKINDVFLFEGLHPNPTINFFVTHNIFIDYLTDDEEKILIDAIERSEKLGVYRAEFGENQLYLYECELETLRREMAEIRAALDYRFDLKKHRK